VSFWARLSDETDSADECEGEFGDVDAEDLKEGKFRKDQNFLTSVGEGNAVAVCVRVVKTRRNGEVRKYDCLLAMTPFTCRRRSSTGSKLVRSPPCSTCPGRRRSDESNMSIMVFFYFL